MCAGGVLEASLRIEEIVGLVDVESLVGVGSVPVFDELVIDAVGGVAHEAVLQIPEGLESVVNGVGGLYESAQVGLYGIGIVVEVIVSHEFVRGSLLEVSKQLFVFDIGQVAVVPAVEVLGGQTEAQVQFLALPMGIGNEPVGVLGKAFFADEIGFLDGVAFRVDEAEAEFGQFVVRPELFVIA